MTSRAAYSFVTLRSEDWRQTEFIGRDGRCYRVEGYVPDGKGGLRCPTDVCGGLCCEAIPLIGALSDAPCRFWNAETKGCGLEEQGGKAAKPVSCLVWPRRQADIDMVNERFGQGERRCQLSVVEVSDG